MDDFDVVLKARINLEGGVKLPAEACQFDGLAWAQTANVYARRGADERMNFAGSIIDEDDGTERRTLKTG